MGSSPQYIFRNSISLSQISLFSGKKDDDDVMAITTNAFYYRNG